MNEKFIAILESLDEGFAGAVGKFGEENAKHRDEIEKSCKCGGIGGAGKRSVKICNHKEGCPAVDVIKKKTVKEDIEDLDEGRKPLSDEEKAAREEAKANKPKGKRGRPAKSADDDDEDTSGKEGVRDVTLTATYKLDGKKKTDTKDLKDVNIDDLDKEIKKFEKEIYKKTDYEADDLVVKKKIGSYDVDDELDTNRAAIDPDGDDY